MANVSVRISGKRGKIAVELDNDVKTFKDVIVAAAAALGIDEFNPDATTVTVAGEAVDVNAAVPDGTLRVDAAPKARLGSSEFSA
ncbi:MAG: hypothetical protein WBP12_03795 [Candidatus Saccharimonas sp.]